MPPISGRAIPPSPAYRRPCGRSTCYDNAATVTEALALLDKVQIVMVEAKGHKANVHLAIEDASGDSAIIEYIGRQAGRAPRQRIPDHDQ